MKKIYLSLVGLVLCGAVVGQTENGLQERGPRYKSLSPFERKVQPVQSNRGESFVYWVDPIMDMMFNKGINLGADKTKPILEDIFLAPLFMDSTVTYSDKAKIYTVWYNQIGNVMDLQSAYLKPAASGKPTGGTLPIVTPKDSYTIDSLDIWASYVKVNKNATDTLYVWLVWGDSTDATIFTKRKTLDNFHANISAARPFGFGPTIKGTGPSHGNVVSPTAPTSNYKLIKRILTPTDTSKGLGWSNDIYVEVNQVIPAGKTVACFYTYVPQAGTVTPGQSFYHFEGAAALKKQEVNGFAADVWEQIDPAVKTSADWVDYQIDDTPAISSGTRLTQFGRYGISGLPLNNQALIAVPFSAPIIQYKIHGTSTVGITEQASNFSLSQNAPNPFTEQTTIAYQLKAAAKNVSLVIYNVAGVKLFEKTQTNLGAGKYSVEVTNSNFAAGVYFYSLNVDGNQITKRMVVTE